MENPVMAPQAQVDPPSPQTVATIQSGVGEMVLVARYPHEMSQCQNEPVSGAVRWATEEGTSMIRLRRDPAKGPTEAEFTSQVLAFARLHGWLTAHFRPGMTRRGRWVTAVSGDGAGFPDVVLLHVATKRCIVAELKTRKGKLAPEQLVWLGAFHFCGMPAFVWRPTDWPEIERVLGR